MKTLITPTQMCLCNVARRGFLLLLKRHLILAAIAVSWLSVLSSTGRASTTVFTDTFTGVAASSGQSSAGLNAAGWYFANSSAGGAAWTIATDNTSPLSGNTLTNTGGTSNWTTGLRPFSSVGLGNVGDWVAIQFNYHVANSGSGQLGIGLLSTATTLSANTYGSDPVGNAAGYRVYHNTQTAATTAQFVKVTNDADTNLLSATSGSATLGNNSAAHTMILKLTRTATGLQISWAVDGVTLGTYTDTSSPYFTFNLVTFFDGGNTPVYVDNVTLTKQTANAVVLHSSETAEPGNVIGLQGDSLGCAPQVWMQHLWSTTTTLTPITQLSVVNSSSQFVSASIPAWETPGVYAVWVHNGSTYSAPVFVNRARSWGTVDLCGTQVDGGRSFRLFGRNLALFPGVTPKVRFVSGSTSLSGTVTVAGSDEYMLNVIAPSGLVAGSAYDVYVSNGAGGTYGETKAMTVTARSSASDPFAIGVPWGADFTFSANIYNVKTDSRLTLHAVGDGLTDDTAAIQGAINAANAAGGGVVYIPTGSYLLSIGTVNRYSALCLVSNVVLKGDGMNLSHLITSSGTTITRGFGNIYLWTVSNVGFVDLDMDNTASGSLIDLNVDGTVSKVFVLRSRIQSDVGRTVVCRRSSMILIKDCEILNYQTNPTTDGDHGEPLCVSNNTDVIIKNNTVAYHTGRFKFEASVRQLVENNHLTRDVAIGTYAAESGGFDNTGASYTVLLGNVLDKSGTGAYTQHNDGESVLEENVNYDANRTVGTVSSAAPTTLTDSSKSWTYNYGAGMSEMGGQLESVAIVSGPGAGQSRKVVSSTANSLTVDSAWDVVPTSDSKYSLQYIAEHNIVKDNTLTDQPRGIWFYCSSERDLIISGNTLTNNEGIWMRTDYRPLEASIYFETHMDCYIADNLVQRSSGTYPAYIGSMLDIVGAGYSTLGTAHYGVEYRYNTVSVSSPNLVTGVGGEGFWAVAIPDNMTQAISDNTGVGLLGVIFQGNTAINTNDAFHLTTGDYYTVLWGNTTQGVVNTVLDVQGPSATHASVGTVIRTGTANKLVNSFFEGDTVTASPLSTLGTVPASWSCSGRAAAGSGVRQVCVVNEGSPFEYSGKCAAFVDSTATNTLSRLEWGQYITAINSTKESVFSFDVRVNTINGTVGSPDMWIRAMTSTVTPLSLHLYKSGSSVLLSGTVGGVDTVLATLSAGSWYRVKAVMPPAGTSGSLGVKIYITAWGGSTTSPVTVDSVNSTTGVYRVFFNQVTPGYAHYINFDNVTLEVNE